MSQEEILDAISALTVIELKELLDAFEEKFDVTAAAPVAVAAPAPAAGGDAGSDEEQTEFDVILNGAGGQKIQVVKVVNKGAREVIGVVDTFVSFRDTGGFDNQLLRSGVDRNGDTIANKVLVHLGRRSGFGDTIYRQALEEGDSYEENGVTVYVDDIDGDAATVTVTQEESPESRRMMSKRTKRVRMLILMSLCALLVAASAALRFPVANQYPSRLSSKVAQIPFGCTVAEAEQRIGTAPTTSEPTPSFASDAKRSDAADIDTRSGKYQWSTVRKPAGSVYRILANAKRRPHCLLLLQSPLLRRTPRAYSQLGRFDSTSAPVRADLPRKS